MMKLFLKCVCVLVFYPIFNSVVRAEMSVDRLNITIFGVDQINFEDALMESMIATHNLYKNKSKEDILSSGSFGLSEASAEVTVLLTEMLKSVPKNSSGDYVPERSLKKCIDNQTAIEKMTEKIDMMKSAVSIIIKQLKSIEEGDTNDIGLKLRETESKLTEIIDEFIAKTSKFRQYPEVMADSLLTVATVYNRFYPIFLAHNQPDTNAAILPCKVASALEDYRDFYLVWRLSKMRSEYQEYGQRYYPGVTCSAQVSEFGQVVYESFNREGYSNYPEFSWARNGCRNGSEMCVEDIVDRKIYETNSYKDLLKLVRHKIEKFFQSSIDASNEICEKFDDKYSKLPKYPTGFGWLRIRTQFVLKSDGRWDSIDEPYATITVNETELLRTPTEPKCLERYIDGTYTTMRIEKITRIQFAVYEKQADGSYGIVLVLSIPIHMLWEEKKADQYICGVALWKDEFSTDPISNTTETSSNSASH